MTNPYLSTDTDEALGAQFDGGRPSTLAAKRARLNALEAEIAVLQTSFNNEFLEELIAAIEPVCERHNLTVADAFDVLGGV